MAESTLRVAIDGSRARTDARALESDLDRLKRSGDGVDNSVRRLNSTLLKFSSINVAGTLTVGAAVTGFVRLADESANLNARLKLATNSTAELTRAQAALFQISQSTSSSFAETSDLYARFANATRTLGVSQERLLAITTSVNQAVQLSGASSGAANAALIQLGQGLSSGALRGEELNSVLEQTPRLAKAIADGFGVTTGQLRTLAADNKLTAEAIVGALESQRATLESEFGTLPQTVGRSLTELGNTALQAAGQIDQSAGLTKALSGAITSLSDSLQGGAVRGAIEGLASATGLLTRNLDVLVAFFVGRAALPILFTAASGAAATLAGTVSLLGPALGIAAAGALGLQAALAPLLGVVGLTTAVVSGLAIGFVAIRESESDLDRVTRELTEAKKKLTQASGESAEAALKEAFAKRELALAELEQLRNAARQSPFVAGVGQGRERQRLTAEIDALDFQITELQRRQAGEFLPANLPNIGTPGVPPSATGGNVGGVRVNDAEAVAARYRRAEADRTNAIYQRIKATQDESAELQRQFATGERLTEAARELARLKSGELDFQFRGREAAKQQLAIELQGLDTIQKKVAAQDRLNAAASRAAGELQDGPLAAGAAQRAARGARRARRGSIGITFGDIEAQQSAAADSERARFGAQEKALRGGDESVLRRDGLLKENETINDLIERAREEHQARLTEIDADGQQARRDLTNQYVGASVQALGDIASAAESLGKRGFAVYKAAAIAQTIISTFQGAQNAFTSLSSIPVVGPALGGAAAAAAVIGGLARVNQIRSQQYGGGREFGGDVQRSRFYEIGEKGKPEIINSDGRYYLFGAQGNVIPASQSTGNSSPSVNVRVMNNGAPVDATARTTTNSDGSMDIDLVLNEVESRLADNTSRLSRAVDRRTGRKATGAFG
jgi:tape measure domain-containing protein